MIKITVTLAEAEVNVGGYITTEGGCLEMVRRFKESKEPVLVHLGNTPLVIGKLVEMKYETETKLVKGVIDLNVDFNAGGQVLQKLETPEGIRILDCNVKGIIMMPRGKTE